MSSSTKNGWVRLDRSIIDHPIFDDEKCLKIFLWCLCKVDKKTASFSTGRFRAAEWLRMKPTTFYQALKRLERAGAIKVETTTKKTIITVVNWNRYQPGEKSLKNAKNDDNKTAFSTAKNKPAKN